MHNFPNIHNQPLRPNKWVYSVTVYDKTGAVVGGGSIDSIYAMRDSDDYERLSNLALSRMGLKLDTHVVILNLINNPNWR